jgi:hypothetical protein
VNCQKQKTERESSAAYPRIEQIGGLFCPYVKFGAGGPNDTIELLGRFRNRASAERALRRAEGGRAGLMAQAIARSASSQAVAELPPVESTHSLSERIDVEITDGTALLAEFRARGATTDGRWFDFAKGGVRVKQGGLRARIAKRLGVERSAAMGRATKVRVGRIFKSIVAGLAGSAAIAAYWESWGAASHHQSGFPVPKYVRHKLPQAQVDYRGARWVGKAVVYQERHSVADCHHIWWRRALRGQGIVRATSSSPSVLIS